MSSQTPRPFQILLIDDRADLSALKNSYSATQKLGESLNPLLVLKGLHDQLQRRLARPPNWKLVVSKGVALQPNEVQTALSGDSQIPGLENDAKVRTYLESVDVLVLDLVETGGLRGTLTTEAVLGNLKKVMPDIREIKAEDLQSITDGAKESGVGFYHLYSENLAHCQAVFVLTRHDGKGAPPSIKNLLDPFCGVENYTPYTAKFDKGDSGDIKHMVDRIGVLYELHQEGYTLGDKLAEIEFAAHHDLPVMICGESGTGKEYIARHIHQRWALRMIHERKLDPGAIDRMVSVNCAVLSKELGSAELFGHTPNAFTGATDFNLGKILSGGCGINLTPRRDNASRADLAGRTDNRLSGEEPDFEVKRIPIKDAHPEAHSSPLGTLFLDEFGDLDQTIQARLLRYLQSWEVQMVGLPGLIKGARLRVIAATSDPRFAVFAGYTDDGGARMRLRGQWRSATELALPLRSDLLFRVKGQTIRATPVTTGGKWKDIDGAEKSDLSNVDAIADRLIESLRKTEWREDAKLRLIDVIKRQIERVMEAENTPVSKRFERFSGGLPVFGHRREIVRFIELADAYVATHKVSGGRKFDHDKVTPDVIDWLWKPSGIYQLNDQEGADVTETGYGVMVTEIKNEFLEKMKVFGVTLPKDHAKPWTAAKVSLLPKVRIAELKTWVSQKLGKDECFKAALGIERSSAITTLERVLKKRP